MYTNHRLMYIKIKSHIASRTNVSPYNLHKNKIHKIDVMKIYLFRSGETHPFTIDSKF